MAHHGNFTYFTEQNFSTHTTQGGLDFNILEQNGKEDGGGATRLFELTRVAFLAWLATQFATFVYAFRQIETSRKFLKRILE